MVRAAQGRANSGYGMTFRRRGWILAIVGAAGLALATAAPAQVTVTVDGDTAHADISLTSPTGETYEAEATIVFDTPANLSPQSLNITAELVDPDEIDPRLPPDDLPLLCGAGGGVAMDPAFPMMITVEPLDIPWLFAAGFDGGSASGGLEFVNTYSFEIHTHDLFYEPHSQYRVFKAPIGEDFIDITNDVEAGSVRARGRHGAFSQFVIAKDTRSLHALLGLNVLCGVYAEKTNALLGYILGALVGDVLRLDLLNLLAKVVALIPLDVLGAIGALDNLIATIDENAGTELPNVWRASHDVTNSAGEMKGVAEALRFDLQESLDTSANP
jgi:hypothetical protein